MACLAYNSSKVKYNGQSYTREELLEKRRANLLKDDNPNNVRESVEDMESSHMPEIKAVRGVRVKDKLKADSFIKIGDSITSPQKF